MSLAIRASLISPTGAHSFGCHARTSVVRRGGRLSFQPNLIIAIFYRQPRRPDQETVHDRMPAGGEPKPGQLFEILGDDRLTNPKGHAVGRAAFNVHYAVILHIHPGTALYEVFILANRIQHD